MKAFILAIILGLTVTPSVAVEYNKYPTRVDNYPGGNSWQICKGKREDMANCVVDGDTIRVQYRSYRVGNLDTPETLKPKCDAEKAKGMQAKEKTLEMVQNAQTISVTVFIDPLTKDPVRDKYGRILSNVVADGKDIATELKSENLAVDYNGGTKQSWCK